MNRANCQIGSGPLEMLKPLFIMPDEALFDVVTANAQAYAENLKSPVGRILAKRNNNRARHIGSGTFITYRGQEFFLTAAHVLLDANKDEILLLGTRRAAVSINEAAHSYRQSLANEEDLLDVALVRLTDRMKDKLGPTHSLPIDTIVTRERYSAGQKFMIVGFSSSRNARPGPSPLPGMNRSVFVSGMREPQTIDRYPAVREGTHLVIGWSKETSDLKGDKRPRPNPNGIKGMSGSPIFDLGDYSDFGVLAGVERPVPLLAGVFTRYIENENALVGTRLNSLVDLLKGETDWQNL